MRGMTLVHLESGETASTFALHPLLCHRFLYEFRSSSRKYRQRNDKGIEKQVAAQAMIMLIHLYRLRYTPGHVDHSRNHLLPRKSFAPCAYFASS